MPLSYKLFSPRFPHQIPVRLRCLIRATCPTHLIILYLVAQTARASCLRRTITELSHKEHSITDQRLK